MFQINGEKYEELKGCLKEILEQIKLIESINIDGTEFTIKKYFAGDLKFLATVYGINPAHSDYPCLWCTCNLRNALDINAVWPISRTHQEAIVNVNLKSKDERKGYVRLPLVDFIEFDCVLIDTLHLLLRITDKLFDVLFKIFDKVDKNSDSVDLKKRPCLRKFLSYLEKECSLTKPYYVSNGKKIKLRSLSGAERLKFLKIAFENDDDTFLDLFPGLDLKNETFVFREFYELLQIVKQYGAPYRIDLDQLRDRLKSWLAAYSKLNDKDNGVTPYAHAFVFHLPEFLRNVQDINQFNMQGLEKLNDLATKYYHMSTNRHKGEYLYQIIAKRNRIEFFNLGGDMQELDIQSLKRTYSSQTNQSETIFSIESNHHPGEKLNSQPETSLNQSESSQRSFNETNIIETAASNPNQNNICCIDLTDEKETNNTNSSELNLILESPQKKMKSANDDVSSSLVNASTTKNIRDNSKDETRKSNLPQRSSNLSFTEYFNKKFSNLNELEKKYFK